MKQTSKKIFTDIGFWIIAAMIIGCLAGFLMGEKASMFAPLGSLFMQMIKMLVVPLILVSIITGAISLGASRKAGKVAIITFLFIAITSFLSGGLAAFLGIVFEPGTGIPANLVEAFQSDAPAPTVPSMGFWDSILGFIPVNPFVALIQGNIIQIIFFSLFLGFGIGTIADEKKQVVTTFLDGMLDALIWCIRVVMYVAPFGVFGLMADAIGTLGFEIFEKLLNLLWLDIICILIIGLVVYPLCIKFLSNIRITDFFRHMLKPQSVAFSTSSSMATLAVNMEVCEEDLKMRKESVGFVLPLGATLNMTGNVIYYVLAAIFFAQFYGMELTTGAYIAIVATSVISAIGQAGVPGPTFTLFAVFIAGGIPLDGIPLLFAVDRLFDMARTVLNITGDACCAAVVDKMTEERTH